MKKIIDDLYVMGGPGEYEEKRYDPKKSHLQEITRAIRHLTASLEDSREDAFVDNLSAAAFHLERVRNELLNSEIPLSLKVETVKIPLE